MAAALAVRHGHGRGRSGRAGADLAAGGHHPGRLPGGRARRPARPPGPHHRDGCGGDEGYQTVTATAPTAELTRYAVDLRALTGGRGSFTVAYDHYDAVPDHLMASIPAAGGLTPVRSGWRVPRSAPGAWPGCSVPEQPCCPASSPRDRHGRQRARRYARSASTTVGRREVPRVPGEADRLLRRQVVWPAGRRGAAPRRAGRCRRTCARPPGGRGRRPPWPPWAGPGNRTRRSCRGRCGPTSRTPGARRPRTRRGGQGAGPGPGRRARLTPAASRAVGLGPGLDLAGQGLAGPAPAAHLQGELPDEEPADDQDHPEADDPVEQHRVRRAGLGPRRRPRAPP